MLSNSGTRMSDIQFLADWLPAVTRKYFFKIFEKFWSICFRIIRKSWIHVSSVLLDICSIHNNVSPVLKRLMHIYPCWIVIHYQLHPSKLVQIFSHLCSSGFFSNNSKTCFLIVTISKSLKKRVYEGERQNQYNKHILLHQILSVVSYNVCSYIQRWM